MKHLLIVGARGWGREVYDIAQACIAAGQNISVKGFLDDKSDALQDYPNYPPIISSLEDYIPQPDDIFICALGDVSYKKKYTEIILQKGGELATLIHPTAILGNNAHIGYGCVVGAYANISCDTIIGNNVTFSIKAGMGHDSSIGDYSHIGGLTNISGFVSIGKCVTIQPCCNIIPHRIIEDNAIVGTGSVVIRNVKAGTTVFGNPAKVLE